MLNQNFNTSPSSCTQKINKFTKRDKKGVLFTRYVGPWMVSIHIPAPGGNVRSAQAEIEIMSGMSTLISDLSTYEGLWSNCLCSSVLSAWYKHKSRLHIFKLFQNEWK